MSKSGAMAIAATDIAYVYGVVRKANSSFTAGMRMLPPAPRNALYAVYAFCREVDDIADKTGELEYKRQELSTWRVRINGICVGNADGPLARRLVTAIAVYGLKRENFIAIIDGMEMDAELCVRIADDAHLSLYCDRVACAVGRLCARIFGMEEYAGDMLAKSLGEALQLTNILRDLHEDAEQNRLYLPADLLAANGIVHTGDALAVLRNSALPAVCESIAERAQVRYDEARVLIAASERRQVLPAVLMLESYGRVLARLRRGGWRDLETRISLSRPEKFWLFLRHGVFAG